MLGVVVSLGVVVVPGVVVLLGVVVVSGVVLLGVVELLGVEVVPSELVSTWSGGICFKPTKPGKTRLGSPTS